MPPRIHRHDRSTPATVTLSRKKGRRARKALVRTLVDLRETRLEVEDFKATDPEGELVGFVAGSPNWGTHTDWIVTLGVHPAHQRQGLGLKLLKTCEEHMSQSLLALTVRVSNTPAIRLYEGAGYARAYLEPGYYNDGEDGIVMQKELHRL